MSNGPENIHSTIFYLQFQKMKDTIVKLRSLKKEREIKANNLSYYSYEKHMARNTTSSGQTLLSWK